jgi:N-acetylglucosaminyl-diphospho-decaprenol L-rhamnosyltransferase
MTIAVGIVFHRKPARPWVRSEPGLDVLVRANAADGNRPTPWLGFGANHNLLIREAADADWYVALNPDVRAAGDDIKRLVAAADAEGIDVAAPLLEAPWGVEGARAALPGPALWLREAILGAGGARSGPGRVRPSAWVGGACMALRVDRLEARFDEDYFMYFEDVALCHRVAAAGGRVGVCTDVVLAHHSGWNDADPLRWRRGVQYARSAVRFAGETGRSPRSMRAAGLLRFGSRLLAPGRSESERVAARVIARGFASPWRSPGLSELADDFNAGHRR